MKQNTKYLVGHYIIFGPHRKREFHVDYTHEDMDSAMEDWKHLCEVLPNTEVEIRKQITETIVARELVDDKAFWKLNNLESKKLLICICYYHTSEETLKNLFINLTNIKNTYACDYKIVIHTNNNSAKHIILDSFPAIEIHIPTILAHPFLLTWQHRQYIKDHLNDYDVFMYIEDDMLVKYEQLTNYLKNLESMWPRCVPTFVRYEINSEGEKYAVDVTNISGSKNNIININQKQYFVIDKLYCACWILPASLLKSLITEEFTQFTKNINTVRENAASFVNWYLKKPCAIELKKEELQISELCTIHHLSNKYVNWKEQSHFGKTKLSNLLRIN